MGRRYSQEIRAEVLVKLRSGQKVSEASKAYGIKEATVRSWLERETGTSAGETLEVSRLKRENEALLRIIGQLTYKAEVRKKNGGRERC